jgi:hypothetical protein
MNNALPQKRALIAFAVANVLGRLAKRARPVGARPIDIVAVFNLSVSRAAEVEVPSRAAPYK